MEESYEGGANAPLFQIFKFSCSLRSQVILAKARIHEILCSFFLRERTNQESSRQTRIDSHSGLSDPTLTQSH